MTTDKPAATQNNSISTKTGDVKSRTDEEQRQASIWLEVANVRVGDKGVQIQVKGDRADREPVWWTVSNGAVVSKESKADDNAAYRAIADGLDKKRIVLANLGEAKGLLECKHIRIQYSESNSR